MAKPGAAAFDLWSAPSPRGGAPLLQLAGVIGFVRRRWIVMLVTTGVVAGVTVAGARLVFNKYATTALIMVDPRNSRVTQGQEVLPGFGSDAFAIESVVQLAKSEGFLGKVVDRLDLAGDPEFGGSRGDRAAALDALASKLGISRRGATYVIEVAARTADPAKSARLANGAAQLIVSEQSEIRSDSTDKAIALLSKRLAELQERVRRSDDAAASLKAKLKLTDAGQGFTLQERRLAELSRQMVTESARTAEARARMEQLRASSADTVPSSVQSPLLTSLRQELARLGRVTAEQATQFGERHPEVAAVRSQIAGVRQQIRAEISSLRAAAARDLKEAESRESAVAKQLRDAQTQSGDQGREAVGLSELEREARADRAVYEQLLVRYKELSELRDLKLIDIRVAEQAVPPRRAAGPATPLLAILGLALGGLSGVALAGALEFLGRGGKRTAIGRRIGLTVAAEAPRVAVGPGLAEGTARDIRRGIEELVEALGDARVIVVTSPAAGDGKSTIAAHLAAELAARGQGEVLLIEATPPAADDEPEFGLIEILEAERRRPERAVRGPTPGDFFRLPYGGIEDVDDADVVGLFQGPALARLLVMCRRTFEAIVIDAPIASTKPARALAAQADAIVQVVAWDKAKADEIAEACKLTPGALAVLNRVQPSA